MFSNYHLSNTFSRRYYKFFITCIIKNNLYFASVIQFVIVQFFICTSYISYLCKFSVPFHFCVGHSWTYYILYYQNSNLIIIFYYSSRIIFSNIVSMSTRYDTEDSLISSVISGLTSQSSPILPDLTTPIILPKLSLIISFCLLCSAVCSDRNKTFRFSTLLSVVISLI